MAFGGNSTDNGFLFSRVAKASESTSMKIFTYLTSLTILLTSSIVAAQRADKAGSADYPLLSRFEGSTIDAYEETEFDRYRLPTGKAKDAKTLGEALTLEGRVTKIFYLFWEEPKPSLLQLYRSFGQVFAAKDVEILFTCFKEECGLGPEDLVRTRAMSKDLLNGFMGFGDHAYIAGKVTNDADDVYFGVYLKQERQNVAYELHFIEVEAMKADKVSMADIDEGISATGKQAFYGLYFDTGKATLKSSAEAELVLLAQYLKANTDKEYFIVGHTDSVGSYTFNQALSFARAKSVIAALESRYQISVENLTPVGVGPVSPVVANSSENGRSQNRRVELVLR